MEDKKISIDFVPMDSYACGLYRVKNIADVLYGNYTVTISPPGSFHYHNQDYFFTQRAVGTKNMETLLKIKRQTNVKFIIDFDDNVWDELPKYNFTKINHLDNKESTRKYLNELADVIVVTTESLKKSLCEFVPATKINVIPNMLPRFKWTFPRIEAPSGNKILYAGSPTHFSNETHMYGDFTSEWDKFLKDKDMTIMGIKPWFINSDKVYPWTDMTSYAVNFYQIASQCKYVIAPLADNFFNKCKSDLKYLECCAVGRVCLCSDFEDSPYHYAHDLQKIPVKATAKQIEYAFKQCEEHYDEIVKYQYDYLNKRWLEGNLDKYRAIFDKPKVQI